MAISSDDVKEQMCDEVFFFSTLIRNSVRSFLSHKIPLFLIAVAGCWFKDLLINDTCHHCFLSTTLESIATFIVVSRACSMLQCSGRIKKCYRPSFCRRRHKIYL